MRIVLILLIGSLALGSCASRVATSSTAGTGKYTEDLSVWRPEPRKKGDTARAVAPVSDRTRTNHYVEARHDVTEQVDAVLDSIYTGNLSKGFVDGYTIQVYSGIKREDALNVKKRMSQSLPNLESDVQYRQPNFRVRTGKYVTRLQAQRDYLAVKRYFPNAIVIPDRIELQ